MLSKELDSHEEYVAVEDTSHYDREIGDLQSDNHSIDAFDIVSNVSIILGCHEVQIVPSENSKDNEQIDISSCDSFGSATNIKQPTFNIEIIEGNQQQHFSFQLEQQ